MYCQAQEKLRHSLRLFKMENLFLLFHVRCKSCKGDAYHFTGVFFLRGEAMQRDFQVKRWQAAAAELGALIRGTASLHEQASPAPESRRAALRRPSSSISLHAPT